MKPFLQLVGGFLGAGKTTLLLELARQLQARGEKVAVITNDQGRDLIDTQFVAFNGLNSTGITGGCFCCKFEELQDTLLSVAENYKPTWILAEAVGSCTDLVSTVIRPLQRMHADDFYIGPITIVVDPERAHFLLEDRAPFPYEVSYLFVQQVREADIVLLNKSDRIEGELRSTVESKLRRVQGNAQYIHTSALTGLGIESWLEALIRDNQLSGRNRLASLDYDIYARAEAELGWLNASFELSHTVPFDLVDLSQGIGEVIQREFLLKKLEAAHVKIMSSNGESMIKGSLTNSLSKWDWVEKSPRLIHRAKLWINARVFADPNILSDVVAKGVQEICDQMSVAVKILQLESFRPSRPNPTYRE